MVRPPKIMKNKQFPKALTLNTLFTNRDCRPALTLPHYAFVLLLVLCSSATASGQYANGVARSSYGAAAMPSKMAASLEMRVFKLINDERGQHGKSPLRWADQAANVARYHSINMAELEFFSHEDLAGRRSSNRADLLGLRDWRSIGENIAWLKGTGDPTIKVVAQWMRSPSHRSNILDSRFRETGVGLRIADNGTYYFTQVFLLRK